MNLKFERLPMGPYKGCLLAVAGVAGGWMLAFASAARADVKDGVDAWSAGDYSKAVAEWRAPAASDDPDALFNMAQAYRLGRGVPLDVRQAEALYARAAAKGHLKAADNYGLLLFQDGRRDAALPFVKTAAERGDPRAQYLIGVAHFNGDLVPKDWLRAYALVTLANGAGLPQAGPALRQMDDYIPLAQRQQAQTLAASMRQQTDAARSSQMAAADLGEGVAVSAPPSVTAANAPAAAPGAQIADRSEQPGAVAPSVSVAQAAVDEAVRAAGTEGAATAGADYARPARTATSTVPGGQVPGADPKASTRARGAATPASAPAASSPAASGPWKLQLGAFSVAGNADRAWAQAERRAALAGKQPVKVASGKFTRLLASGWPSQGAAQAACSQLKAAGQSCIVTR